jgi:single-strand DNA-binding protein
MAGINKVILVGNVGRDAELRYTQNQTAVANFTLATNEVRTSKSGERQERTEWHRIVVWGRQAEIANEYVKKGKLLGVEGSIRTRQWDDREGQKRYTTEIHTDRFIFLGRAEGTGRLSSPPAGEATEGGEAGSEAPRPDDDIPF